MDIEKINNGEIRNEIRKYLGFPKEPDKNTASDEEINRFRSITLQIKYFLDHIVDPDSPLNWFNVKKMTEENFIKLAAFFINRSEKNRNIYQQMKKLKTILDYKSLYYDRFKMTISDSLYADYRSLIHSRKEIDNSMYISRDFYTKIRNLFGYFYFLEIAIDIHKPNQRNWYTQYVSLYKYINDCFFREIETIDITKTDTHELSERTFIEFYTDFICNMINISLFSGVYSYTTFRHELNIYPPLRHEDAFAIILKETKKIKNDIAFFIERSKPRKDLDFNDYIISYVFYLERNAIYKELSLTRELLLSEIIKNPDDFSFDVFYKKVRKKLFKLNFKSEKHAKFFISEYDRITDYPQKRQSIDDLLNIAKKNNNIYTLFTATYKLFFREIYHIKTISPAVNESAKTILQDFLTYGCDWKGDKELSTLGADNYTIFKAKRHLRQRIRFMDAKFTRAYIVNYYDHELYNSYCDIIITTTEVVVCTAPRRGKYRLNP